MLQCCVNKFGLPMEKLFGVLYYTYHKTIKKATITYLFIALLCLKSEIEITNILIKYPLIIKNEIR